jgi:hypothetical protein
MTWVLLFALVLILGIFNREIIRKVSLGPLAVVLESSVRECRNTGILLKGSNGRADDNMIMGFDCGIRDEGKHNIERGNTILK